MDRGDTQPAVITRKEAKARGFTRYWTGKSCKRGHVAERTVAGGHCLECERACNAARYAANPERGRAINAAWAKANPERVRAYAAAHYAANPERWRARDAAYRKANPDKVRAREAAWAKANPEKRGAHAARRRALKLAATCTCCTQAEIDAVYACSPKGHEVDHKLALALGGAHCVHNLEVLTVAEHRAKTKPDLRAIADAKWLVREQAAGRIPGDPAATAATFRMTGVT